MGYLLSRDPWLLYVPVPAIFVRLSALIVLSHFIQPATPCVSPSFLTYTPISPLWRRCWLTCKRKNQTLYSAWVMWWDIEQIHWRV